jgi:hypothetical protein
MTDLNAVVPADSSLYMWDPSTINSVGEIVGLALDKNSGACCHGFLAIPDNSAVAESVSTAAQGSTSERPTVVLPENVRRVLRQRLGSRYHIPGLGTSKQD